MIDLSGQTPTGVRCSADAARIQWRIDGQTVETDFARFQPVRLFNAPRAGTLRAVWQDFADLAMTDPFLNRTRKKAAAAPQRSKPFATNVAVLRQVAKQPDNLPFSGAIFHLARVGSTLIHRLLTETQKVLSLSEPNIIEQSFTLTGDWPARERTPFLRDVMSAISQPRRPTERHLVIKMVVVMNAEFDAFAQAFPDVPWILVYREPVEIMVSLLRQGAGFIEYWRKDRADVAERFGIPAVADPAMSVEEYLARALGRFSALAIEAAKAARPGRFLAVDYRRLPDAVWETIAPHFGISLSDSDVEVMREQARYSAKSEDQVEFSPDSDDKHKDASPEVRKLAERFVVPMIEELRALPQG